MNLGFRKRAEAAKKGNFDYFTTTLSISPMKNTVNLNEIGMRLAEEYQVAYLLSDFKKRMGINVPLIYRRNTDFCERIIVNEVPNGNENSEKHRIMQ